MAARKTTTTEKPVRAAKTVAAKRTTLAKKTVSRKTTKNDMMMLDASSETSKKRMSFMPRVSRKVVLSVLGILILAGLVYGASKYLVVAWVNNKPITIYEYYKELDKKDGATIKDQIIRERLVADEAAKRGINIGKTEVDARAKQIEDQQGGAEQLNQRLQMSGLTRDDFLKLVKQQVIIEKMFGQGINVTDADVEKFITDNKDQMPATIDDKVKQQVKDEIKQQKINGNYSKWLDEAMKGKSVIKV